MAGLLMAVSGVLNYVSGELSPGPWLYALSALLFFLASGRAYRRPARVPLASCSSNSNSQGLAITVKTFLITVGVTLLALGVGYLVGRSLAKLF